MPGKAAKVIITVKQQAILRSFANATTVSVSLAQRSQIILLAFEGHNNEAIEQSVGLHHDVVGKWRRRWRDDWERLTSIECAEKPHVLVSEIKKILADRPRSGRKPKIDSEQQAALFKTACEEPQKKIVPSRVGAEQSYVCS